MSKHAVQGFFDAFRVELVRSQITVGLFCPGYVKLRDHSGGGMGHRTDQDSGRLKDPKKNGIDVEKCAAIYCSSMYNRVRESWVAGGPLVFYSYMRQYAPWLYFPLVDVVGPARIDKLTEHQSE